MTEKFKNITTIILFSIILIGFSLNSIFLPKEKYSLSERREKATFPTEGITEKDFYDKFDAYMLDHFAFREGFRTIKALSHYYVFRHTENNGIAIINGSAVKLSAPLDEKAVKYTAQHISDIQKKYLSDCRVFISLVPDKAYFASQNDFYPGIDYEKMQKLLMENISNAEYINIFPLLSLEHYYQTDSHWNQKHLLPVAKEIANKMGVMLTDKYNEKSLYPFYGVYYGQSALPLKPDDMVYLQSETLSSCKVNIISATGKRETTVYETDKFGSKDSYDLFLSGAANIVEIENPKSISDKELIIFRDSFGSSLAPLLVEGYDKVTLIDTRYISMHRLEKYVQFNNQDVLFLYNTALVNSSFVLK